MSSTVTVCPSSASWVAMRMAAVVLPTPPFRFTTAIVFMFATILACWRAGKTARHLDGMPSCRCRPGLAACGAKGAAEEDREEKAGYGAEDRDGLCCTEEGGGCVGVLLVDDVVERGDAVVHHVGEKEGPDAAGRDVKQCEGESPDEVAGDRDHAVVDVERGPQQDGGDEDGRPTVAGGAQGDHGDGEDDDLFNGAAEHAVVDEEGRGIGAARGSPGEGVLVR